MAICILLLIATVFVSLVAPDPCLSRRQPSLPGEATAIGTVPSVLARQIHSKPYPPYTHDEKLSPPRPISAFPPSPSRPSTPAPPRGDFALGFVAASIAHDVLTLEQLVIHSPLCGSEGGGNNNNGDEFLALLGARTQLNIPIRTSTSQRAYRAPLPIPRLPKTGTHIHLDGRIFSHGPLLIMQPYYERLESRGRC